MPDLTDGEHTLRIKYDPNFDENAVPHPSFQTNGYTTNFLEVEYFELAENFFNIFVSICRMPTFLMAETATGEQDLVCCMFTSMICTLL